VYTLVIGTAVSRIGLWVFDISVTLLYQEFVPAKARGLVGGTQKSLNSVFTLSQGILGLIFRKPNEFWILASTGYLCIGLSGVLYLSWIVAGVQNRFQLLVRDRCNAVQSA
jgi:iron-regulated transporter 1